jgi:hypothetical protein
MSNKILLKKKLYILFISELNISKIGISRNVKKRLSQLQTGCPYEIKILKVYESDLSSKIEKILHRQFRSYKIDSSEYNLVGEWFNLDIDTILKFNEICNEIEKNIIYLREKKNPFIK